MKRIMIIGSPGSGKSTLAKKLSEKLNLPIVYLDFLYWLHYRDHVYQVLGRVNRPAKNEFNNLVMYECQKDAWIMDGNFISSLADRIPFADTIIFLDMPRKTCIWRIIKRTFKGLLTYELYASGCPSKHAWEFFNWVWHWKESHHDDILRVIASASHAKMVLLKSPAEVTDFLAKL